MYIKTKLNQSDFCFLPRQSRNKLSYRIVSWLFKYLKKITILVNSIFVLAKPASEAKAELWRPIFDRKDIFTAFTRQFFCAPWFHKIFLQIVRLLFRVFDAKRQAKNSKLKWNWKETPSGKSVIPKEKNVVYNDF